jgi:hypothetical protein
MKTRGWRDEAEPRPRQIIEAVGQVVLDADPDDVPVFFHPCAINEAQPPETLNPQLAPLLFTPVQLSSNAKPVSGC